MKSGLSKYLEYSSRNCKAGCLLIFFFASGFSALVYQVSWQRALFSMTGTDLESTTIIVTLFMLGLGAGAIIGGQIADRLPKWRIQTFAFTEFVIGLYGAWSLKTIAAASTLQMEPGPFSTLLKATGALLLPTLLMGTTLPILVTHLYKQERNVGVSVGKLYMSNTLGAACGAGVTGFILFGCFGLSGTVGIAATINFLVALFSLIFLCRE